MKEVLATCERGTRSFQYGIRQVDWLGSCFPPADGFTALLFQNENFYLNMERNMCVVPPNETHSGNI